MEKIKAFPGNDLNHCHPGMDLRDFFAAATLQGIIINSAFPDEEITKKIAAKAYELADAMMEARKK